jgi:hypothetical protein
MSNNYLASGKYNLLPGATVLIAQPIYILETLLSTAHVFHAKLAFLKYK